MRWLCDQSRGPPRGALASPGALVNAATNAAAVAHPTLTKSLVDTDFSSLVRKIQKSRTTGPSRGCNSAALPWFPCGWTELPTGAHFRSTCAVLTAHGRVTSCSELEQRMPSSVGGRRQ